MKREEKRLKKAKELQEQILDKTFKENFSGGNSYMMQPYEATMMKGRMTLTQDTIFENIQLAFQTEYRKQVESNMKKGKEQLSLWDKPMDPIRIYFNRLGVRPDCYDEVHKAALAMGKQVVDVEGVNEDGDKVINYMPIFTKVSVPVITFDEINRSEDATKTPYKNKERRKGYIEFTVNPEIGSTYFEITSKYTKFLPGAGTKCKCCYSPNMYRYSAHWRDLGGKWELDYISFRRLLGLREVMPVERDGRPTYEEVDTVYPDFGEVRRFVLEKTQKEVKELADKNEFDCYFTYEIVMPIKGNGKRATRGNPEKIVFHVHLSELGEQLRKYNNVQQMNIRMEQMLIKEFRMSKQSAMSLTSRITEETRLKFSNKVMELLTYVIDPGNGVKDRGGYAYMALNNFLEEILPSVEELVPEKSQSQNNNPTSEIVHEESEDSLPVSEEPSQKGTKEECPDEILQKWWEVLDFVRERMTKELFDIHILPLYPCSFDGDTLTIAAPNEYIYKEIRTKYESRLLEIVRECFSKEINVEYVRNNQKTEEMVAMYEQRCAKK